MNDNGKSLIKKKGKNILKFHHTNFYIGERQLCVCYSSMEICYKCTISILSEVHFFLPVAVHI